MMFRMLTVSLMALCLLSILTGCATTTQPLGSICPPLPPLPASLAAPPLPLIPLAPEPLESPRQDEERSLLKPDFWRLSNP